MKPKQIERIHQVISGKATDLPARLLRTGLGSLEPVYRALARQKNRRFDQPTNRVTFVDRPVISVGNLTTGGTGKTPLVRWIVDQLLSSGQTPAIVSRGYGSVEGKPNDEFLELKFFLPAVGHQQDPDRVAAARSAIEQYSATAIVLDDGFQHRRLGRNLDLVLIDATNPFGYDHLIPRGLLREPLGSLQRADAVIVTRCDQVTPQHLALIQERIQQHVAKDRIALVQFMPSAWIDANGTTASFQDNDPVVAFCGIGNPEGFQRTLTGPSIETRFSLCEFRAFPDHHAYQESDWLALQNVAVKQNAVSLICTVKDLVKVRQFSRGQVPVRALAIEPHFQSGQAMITDLLQQTIQQHGNIE